MMTPTARSITFPRIANSLNSFSIPIGRPLHLRDGSPRQESGQEPTTTIAAAAAPNHTERHQGGPSLGGRNDPVAREAEREEQQGRDHESAALVGLFARHVATIETHAPAKSTPRT